VTSLFDTLQSGLAQGALYALVGLGLSLSLGMMKVINIAHGDLIVLGVSLASAVAALSGLNALACSAIVFPLMFGIGWLLQRYLLNREDGTALSPLLLTFALSIVLQNLQQEVLSPRAASIVSDPSKSMRVASGAMLTETLPWLTVAVTVGLYALTGALMSSTRWGRQLRAIADDPGTARLVGVNDKRLLALTAGGILAVTSVAAIVHDAPSLTSSAGGSGLLLSALEAVFLAGPGSLWGTFIGGLVIGIVHALGQQAGAGLGEVCGHLVFLAALVVRPRGLFGRGVRP